MALGWQVEEGRSRTEANEKGREGAKEEGEGRSEEAKSRGRKKQEWQNRKRKLPKEKTQKNTRRRVNLDSSSESDDALAAVNDVVVAVGTSGRYEWIKSKIVQTQVLFAFDARDSYLFVFVRTVTVMRTMVFHVLFVSLTSLMVCQENSLLGGLWPV